MKITTVLALALFIAGCGAEPMGAAATGAEIKRREIEQGRTTLEQSKSKLEQAVQLQEQRADQAGDRN
jgi:PBP1b-binding outer membrane lipoprotein LpoB